VLILLLIGGITKRAQIPFSPWLPAAMAAPTPVSALVHSSTLVTAGVYLLLRFHSLWCISISSYVILYTGLITSLIAGILALYERDIKKIIALSTLRQLGIIILRLGAGIRKLCLFHLITHALFKSLLFICGGNLIHSRNNNQDIRLFNSLINQLPFTNLSINISILALIGFPFMAGYYRKETILENSKNINNLVFICIFTAAI
jgi:NADH-ubiquinone oxidoreductase chain 5